MVRIVSRFALLFGESIKHLPAVLVVLVICACLRTPANVGERIRNADSEPFNWMSTGRTYYEQRYSPLAEINDGNVQELGLDLQDRYGPRPVVIVDVNAGSNRVAFAFKDRNNYPDWTVLGRRAVRLGNMYELNLSAYLQVLKRSYHLRRFTWRGLEPSYTKT